MTLNHAGEYNGEATPVPISNTEVKLSGAENTCLETDWEDRFSPAFLMQFYRIGSNPDMLISCLVHTLGSFFICFSIMPRAFFITNSACVL